MILRIDDMIASTGSSEPDLGCMEVMGGMPGGMPPI